jgi:ferric-dicitrate binding protein FerR (iron transport regulator)
MSIADDGREPDPPRGGGGMSERPERPTNDPDEVTRRGAAGRRLVALIAGVVLVVVLVVWLIVYLSAREASDESMGAGPAPAAPTVVSVVQ